MPVKWKIFLALNCIMALPIFAFLAFNIYHHIIYNSFTYIFGSALLIMMLNSFLNIYLLQRFFPDRSIPVFTRRLNLLSLILTSIIAIGLLILIIFGANEEFGRRHENDENRDPTGKIVLLILIIVWIIQLAILTMQAQLPRRVAHNNRERMNSLIDSIGQ